jgi:hypothetical protein
MRWRTNLTVLGVCGVCCSLAASCIGEGIVLDFRSGGGGSGSGSGGGGGEDISLSSGGNGDTCAGTCQPAPTRPTWSRNFVLLWLGSAGQAPPCPQDVAPTDWFRGVPVFTDLVAPDAKCAPCTCQPPKGSCALPRELAAYYSHPAECPAPMGTPFKAFGAPDGWDGSCTTYDAIPGDPTCSGSGCLQHLMIPPLVVTDPPTCEPVLPPPPKIEPAYWAHSARVCYRAEPPGHCLNSEEFCAPTAPAGFLECIFLEGVGHDCPPEWADKHEIYTESTITDTRGCDSCTCEAPVGSKCGTSVSVYTDDCCGCSDPGAPALLTLGVDSTHASCGDITPIGSALGSKKATAPVYQPGSCTSLGGGPVGKATGVEPKDDSAYTTCCRPSRVPR